MSPPGPAPGPAPDPGRLTDPALYRDGDPFALYAALRRQAPVAWVEPSTQHGGFWAVTTHPEVSAIGADPGLFCSSQGILVDEIGTNYDAPPTMMHTDPPQHTRYRRLVQPAFKPSMVRVMEAGVAAKAGALIEPMEAGEVIDIVPTLSIPFPLQVICELLGVDGALWPRFYEWSEAVIPGESERSGADKARLQLEMWEYLIGVADERRVAPADNLVSVLAAAGGAEGAGGHLSEAELAMFLIQLLVAGNETTRNLLSGGLIALSEHPDQWAALRADRSLIPDAVEELLRWTTPVISFLRTATRPTTVHRQAIAQGEPVLLVYASANRDEAVFGDDADRLRIDRHPNPHVSFGFGPHFCLGAALARLEARIVLDQLLDRFTTIAPAGPVERTASPVIAGIRHAPLVFRR
ncbi:MAG TPA: cytochrome P450 [Acidimicrobiales bacterium]|nr:cytochrome P450 [Acidimicrobiales bacterium]